MANIPKAETFETCLTSSVVGFLATLKTLTHLPKKSPAALKMLFFFSSSILDSDIKIKKEYT